VFNRNTERVGLRDQSETWRKKPPDFANEEWRKFDEPPGTTGRTGPIFLFAEKRSETRPELTSALKPVS
jgi:hypothetical protein